MLSHFSQRFGPRASAEPSGPLASQPAACYMFSLKKSGTHLVRNVLGELGLACIDRLDYAGAEAVAPTAVPGGSFVLSHRLPPQKWRGQCQAGSAKIIMSLRDPRAVFLSLLDFYDWTRPLSAPGMHTVEFRRESCRHAYRDREELGLALLEDELLDDDPFTPWLNFRKSRTLYYHPGVLKLRYEELAAANGGSDPSCDHPISRVCTYLGLAAPQDPAATLQKAVHASSPTMNVGVPDRWRTALSPHLLSAFMARHGELVREFGYGET